jgi:ankyrin repeat protein
VQAVTSGGLSTLHAACETGQVATVALLLQHRADPNTHFTATGETPLLNACVTGRQDVISLLLRHAANPDAADLKGRTPLHVACALGQEATVRALLQAGASLEPEDERGLGAMDWASAKHRTTIVQLLQAHAAAQAAAGQAKESASEGSALVVAAGAGSSRKFRYACGWEGCAHPEQSLGRRFLKCERCRVVFYCGQPCQAGHWAGHKSACRRPEFD